MVFTESICGSFPPRPSFNFRVFEQRRHHKLLTIEPDSKGPPVPDPNEALLVLRDSRMGRQRHSVLIYIQILANIFVLFVILGHKKGPAMHYRALAHVDNLKAPRII